MKKPIAFYPDLAIALGGISEAIYYQQLYFWGDKGKRSDGFIYKSKKEIQDETTLTRDQQDRIREKLVKGGWLEVKNLKANNAPTLHYKTLREITFSISGKPANPKSGNVANQISGKPANLITETTTENTTERVEASSTVSRDLIQFMVEEYKKIKGFNEVKGWDKVNFPRHGKEAKQIIEMLKANFTDMDDEETKKEILRCLKEFVQWENKTKLSWQLSTVVKKFGEYMSDTLLTK